MQEPAFNTPLKQITFPFANTSQHSCEEDFFLVALSFLKKEGRRLFYYSNTYHRCCVYRHPHLHEKRFRTLCCHDLGVHCLTCGDPSHVLGLMGTFCFTSTASVDSLTNCPSFLPRHHFQLKALSCLWTWTARWNMDNEAKLKMSTVCVSCGGLSSPFFILFSFFWLLQWQTIAGLTYKSSTVKCVARQHRQILSSIFLSRGFLFSHNLSISFNSIDLMDNGVLYSFR